jgi:hypothetical protein
MWRKFLETICKAKRDTLSKNEADTTILGTGPNQKIGTPSTKMRQ